MGKKMLINATLSGEGRVAIVEDGLLTELDIEVAGSENTKGNIYKAEVVRIEPGLQAAFVNYGAQRHGFLQIGDIHPDLWPKRDSDNKQRPPITEILRRGQQLLIQVVKEERGTKGAAVTTELSLAGRYMVLMANSRSRGISRKIDKDSTRKKIKEALKELELPDEIGYIIRTAAIDQPPEELKRDFNYLFNIYKNIIDQAENATAPALIYQESSLVLRSVRDYFTQDMDEVLIDDKEIFKQTREFFKTVMPDHVKLVKLHQERRPIFSRYQIEEQIAQLTNNSVTLPSGGSIVLDQTEALVAIDVNSGKVSSEQSIESTACLVNVEAATEIARQLRLRDLGGLVVIDFIDMRQRKNARKVEKTLEQALKQDKARVTQGRISTLFGLLEMSRQRIKPNLGAASYSSCPHCNGSGLVRSSESRAISLLRRIQAGTAKGKIEKVTASVALDVGTILLNQKRSELRELELQQHINVWINPRPDFLPDQVEMNFIKDTGEQEHDNVEQKALVDTNFADRSKDFDFSNAETKTDSVASASNSNFADTSSDSNETETQAAAQPKRPRRSRPTRQRRPRTSTNDQGEASKNPAQTEVDSTQQPDNKSLDTKQTLVKQEESATPKSAPQAAEIKDVSESMKSADAPIESSNSITTEAEKNLTSQRPASTTTAGKSTPGSNTDLPQQGEGVGGTDVGADAGVEKQPQPKDALPQPQQDSPKTQSTGSGSSDSGASKTEKPKRKRAPRRAVSTTKEDTAPQNDAPNKQQDEAADEIKTKTPAAAARQRMPRKRTSAAKPTPAEVTGTDTSSTPTTAEENSITLQPSAQEDKPAPVRKRRTTAKSSATSRSTSKKEADTPAAANTKPEKAAEEEKAPRRRTATTRSKTRDSGKKADTETTTATTLATPTSEVKEKPAVKRAPRRTTTRRKPAAAQADTAKTEHTTENESPPEEPKTPQPGSTPVSATKDKTTPAPEPRRKTGARKPAATKKSKDDTQTSEEKLP